MTELSSIKEDEKIPTTQNMISNLLDANEIVLKSLDDARKKAEEDGMFGYVNFLEERMMIHAKHGWMLKSIMKKQ